MSGHSKWATTKRQKAAVDAKRGAAFTKIGNLLSIAARKGGGAETNFALRMAIDKARAVNMPKDNIERAIKRGTGELGGAEIHELLYEGIGPAKVQFIVKVATDNKNRSAGAIRHLFADSGGSLGSVLWNFTEQGVIRIGAEALGQNGRGEDFELALIDAGAADIIRSEEGITILTATADLAKVKAFLEARGLATESAELEYIAKEKLALAPEELARIESFMEDLDENEDVVDYYTNLSD